jgi:hypothetical protein
MRFAVSVTKAETQGNFSFADDIRTFQRATTWAHNTGSNLNTDSLVLLIYETAIPVFQKQDIFLKKF